MESRASTSPVAILLSLLAAMIILLDPSGAAAARPGTLDRSFGQDGRAYSRLPDTFVGSEFTALVRQPDGKLLVTARLETETGGSRGAIQRRGPRGNLDPSFGKNGSISVPSAHGLALQGDGRILFGVDETSNVCGVRGSVRRLEPSGDPDPSFGASGASSRIPLSVERIAVGGDGKVVVAGRAFYGPCGHDLTPRPELAIARLQPDGTLDPSFGHGGVVLLHSDDQLEESEASGLEVLADGAVLVAGSSSLLRFTAAGALDPSFGSGGLVEPVGKPRALLALPSGEAVLASLSSQSCCLMPGDFVLSRYRADGSLEPGFGDGGRAHLDYGVVDEATALAEAPGGGIVLAGDTAREGCEGECNLAMVLARFSAAGALDPSFGEGGRAVVFAPPGPGSFGRNESITAIAVTPSGQMLAAGSGGSREDAFILGREPSGALDSNFGRVGSIQEIRKGRSVTEAVGLAIEPNGEILVSAQSNSGLRRSQPILLNYKPTGHPDRRVGGRGFLPTEASGALRAAGRGRIFSVVVAEPERVVRVDSRGHSDRRYGSKGAARLPAGFNAASFLVHDNGKVLVVGRMAHRWGMAAFQLNRRGHPDPRFGDDGLAVAGFGKEVNAEARSATIDSRGRIVLAGSVRTSAAVVRLLPSGKLDRSFARQGRLPNLLGRGTKATRVVALRGGGVSIAVSPEAGIPQRTTRLLRLGDHGSRDRFFGHGGILRARGSGPLLGLFAGPHRIVLVSAHSAYGKGGVTLRAYKPNGTRDLRYGRRGVTVAATSQHRAFRPVAAARQHDGRIVVVGTAGKIEEPGSAIELLRFR